MTVIRDITDGSLLHTSDVEYVLLYRLYEIRAIAYVGSYCR